VRVLAKSRNRPRMKLLMRGDEDIVRAKLGAVLARAGVASDANGIEAIAGDVTHEGLGLSTALHDRLREEVTSIIHAAADTGFAQSRDDAYRRNVVGTARVLEFARSTRRAPRFGYVSTAYVAGRRTGEIAEEECSTEGPFFTEYERSKAMAEALVRAQRGTLPISILRLSIVVGRRTDGDILSLGGLYRVFRLAQQGLLAMLPGEPTQPVDLVPVDYAADAIAWLMREGFREDATYHVCAGPERSLALSQIMPIVMDCIGALEPSWRAHGYPAPVVVAPEVFQDFVGTIERVGNARLRALVQNVQTFTRHLEAPKRYATSALERGLEGSGLELDHARAWLPTLITHAHRHDFGARNTGVALGEVRR
jgi:nucleoside-diphosphate-sugar epimerase